MTLRLAPPPIQVPPQFTQDKSIAAFFNSLLNTLYQIWVAVFAIRFSGQVKTTDATQTGLLRVEVPLNKTVMIDAVVVARRTGGSSGTNGDSAFYNFTGAYKNIGGVLTGIGTPGLTGGEDQAAWDVVFTDSGGFAIVAVIGAAGNDITWEGTAYTYTVGS